MKRILLVLGVLAGLANTVDAGLTLVSRETFQGLGTLNATAPGNLGTVTGSFYKRPGGPRLTTDATVGGRGWSADLQGQSLGYCQPAAAGSTLLPNSGSGDRGNFAVRFWVYLDVAAPNQQICSVRSGGNNLLAVTLGSTDGLTCAASSSGTVTGPGLVLPKNQWVEFTLAWAQVPGYYWYQGSLLYRFAGQTAPTEAFSVASFALHTSPATLQVGFIPVAGTNALRARFGMLSLYTLGAWADRTLPDGTVADPAGGPFDWYVNPATGNDNNDGTTAATAWSSVAKLNAESAALGMIPVSTGYANGDTLHLDCTGAPLPILSSSLRIKTRGLKIKQTGGALDPMATLAASGWTPVGGSTKTFSTTDGGAADLTSIVPTENGRFLNHPTGASFSAVQGALDAAPGSFYCDGTTLYLHPFGDTDPRTDGKVYRRTRYRDGGGTSAVCINAPDVWWDGLLIAGTTLADKATNDSVGSYCFQWDTFAGGTNLLSNFSVDHFSKHGIGRTCGGSNGVFTRQNGVYGRATPYDTGYGATSSDVDFSGDATSTGNVANYVNCSEVANSDVVGSALGQSSSYFQFWTSHADSVAFSAINVTNCTLVGTWYEQGDCSLLNIQGSTVGQIFCAHGLTVAQSRVKGSIGNTIKSTSTNANEPTLLQNSILVISAVPGDGTLCTLPKTASVLGCTADLTGLPSGGFLFARSVAGSSLTIRNLLLLRTTSTANNLVYTCLLYGYDAGDTLALDHNAYQPGAGNCLIARDYNDGTTTAPRTLTQWQALGMDAGSFSTTSAVVDASLRPLPQSPLIGAGADLGGTTDYTGKWFAHRTTIGAYEPPPGTFAQWQADYFTTPQLGDTATSSALANPAGDGVANLLKYAFNLDPNTVAPASAFPIQGSDGVSAAITYTVATWAADLTYTVEQSADLVAWTASSPTYTVLADDGTTQRIKAAVPMGTNRRLFLRLRVSRL